MVYTKARQRSESSDFSLEERHSSIGNRHAPIGDHRWYAKPPPRRPTRLDPVKDSPEACLTLGRMIETIYKCQCIQSPVEDDWHDSDDSSRFQSYESRDDITMETGESRSSTASSHHDQIVTTSGGNESGVAWSEGWRLSVASVAQELNPWNSSVSLTNSHSKSVSRESDDSSDEDPGDGNDTTRASILECKTISTEVHMDIIAEVIQEIPFVHRRQNSKREQIEKAKDDRANKSLSSSLQKDSKEHYGDAPTDPTIILSPHRRWIRVGAIKRVRSMLGPKPNETRKDNRDDESSLPVQKYLEQRDGENPIDSTIISSPCKRRSGVRTLKRVWSMLGPGPNETREDDRANESSSVSVPKEVEQHDGEASTGPSLISSSRHRWSRAGTNKRIRSMLDAKPSETRKEDRADESSSFSVQKDIEQRDGVDPTDAMITSSPHRYRWSGAGAIKRVWSRLSPEPNETREDDRANESSAVSVPKEIEQHDGDTSTGPMNSLLPYHRWSQTCTIKRVRSMLGPRPTQRIQYKNRLHLQGTSRRVWNMALPSPSVKQW